MRIEQIKEKFGARGVVAFSCRSKDSVPTGGFVVAVQNEPTEDYDDLRAYLCQFKKKYPDKGPVFFLRLDGETLTYDNGNTAKTALRKLEIIESYAMQTLKALPAKTLAKALSSSIKTGKS